MTVSILSLSARGEGEIAVTFALRDGDHVQKDSFLISATLMLEMHLKQGESTQECYDAVSHAAQVYRAKKKGLYLLGYGSCSERALCRKLVAKGVTRDVAREAVERLRRDGYLNEVADAEREAERCVSKTWGRRRMVDALRAKGFPQEAIRSALDHLEDIGVDWIELCADRIRNQCAEIPADRCAKQKMVASLMRYGFSASEIREAIELVREENE